MRCFGFLVVDVVEGSLASRGGNRFQFRKGVCAWGSDHRAPPTVFVTDKPEREALQLLRGWSTGLTADELDELQFKMRCADELASDLAWVAEGGA